MMHSALPAVTPPASDTPPIRLIVAVLALDVVPGDRAGALALIGGAR
jgi:hypothetical protein